MGSPISPAALETLLHEAARAARRLVRRMRLPAHEEADLRQEFLVDLIARFAAFDPERGSLGAFAGTVTAHKACRLATKILQERRMFGAVPVSLDEPLWGDPRFRRIDAVPEEAGLLALLGQSADAIAQLERRLDVARGLGALELDDAILCRALADASIDRLAAAGRGSRSSLYRRVKRIRFELLAAGVGSAWDVLASA